MAYLKNWGNSKHQNKPEKFIAYNKTFFICHRVSYYITIENIFQ